MAKFEGKITGFARSVRDLLSNRRYGLEYYQREYAWGHEQVEELVADLVQRFLDQHEKSHTRKSVSAYREYFLGPIITSEKDGTKFIIDGQQRLTTITLLLIVLRDRISDEDQRASLQQLIYSEEYGERTLTLNVEEREEVFQALISGQRFVADQGSASVRNIVDRFADIDELLTLEDDLLPLFCDWLLGKAILVEIDAPDSQVAYEIFETMNDRGLNLTPTDMLKGFLLSNIQDDARIAESDGLWRERVLELTERDAESDAAFFKAWLRAHYAETIRDRAKNAVAEDWDLIGTQYHKWVRENPERMDLNTPSDFHWFVRSAFDRMSSHYLRMVAASRSLTPGLEHVRYNATTKYTLQLTACLSPIRDDDDLDVADQKIELVARFLNIFVARRILTYRNFGYSPTYYSVFLLTKRIRKADLNDLRALLKQRLEEDSLDFEPDPDFGLHGRNGPQIRYILARLTDHLERSCKDDGMFDSIMKGGQQDPFEIEHIWADHFDRHTESFGHESEFARARNRLGGLLLLRKSFNASFGDLDYESKVEHYRGQNRLAASLHASAYRNNPTFNAYVKSSGHPFQAYASFGPQELAERQALYLGICREIWSPSLLDEVAPQS